MDSHQEAAATREDLLGEVIEPARFVLPTSGKVCWVQPIDGKELERYYMELARHGRGEHDWDEAGKARLVIRCVTSDHAGQRKLFRPSDADALAARPAGILNPLFELCQHVNGIDEESRRAAKKNCAAPTSSSASASPATSAAPIGSDSSPS
jgi:hypothetical protein